MPLAHILTPQIARRVEEIETAIHPLPGQSPAGYLKASGPQPYAGRAGATPGRVEGIATDSGEKAADFIADKTNYLGVGYLAGAIERAPADPTGITDAAFNEEDFRTAQETVKRNLPEPAFDPRGVAKLSPHRQKEMDKQLAADLAKAGPVASSVAQAGGALRRARNPVADAVSAGMWDSLKPQPQVLPNPPAPADPTYFVQPEPKKVDAKGRQIIQLDPKAPLVNEYGEAVDRRGRKTKQGYLGESSAVGQIGKDKDGFRTADYVGYQKGRQTDVTIKDDQSEFGTQTLEKVYEPHVQEFLGNDEKWPKGYLQQFRPEVRKNIKEGVKEVLKRRAETYDVEMRDGKRVKIRRADYEM